MWAGALCHYGPIKTQILYKDLKNIVKVVSWSLFENGMRLIFKADISAPSRYGVQISGVYTDPSVRNQGVATRAMRELCRLLFVRGWPRVTLYVNEGNQPALKVYERVGFSYLHDYMTIFVSEP